MPAFALSFASLFISARSSLDTTDPATSVANAGSSSSAGKPAATLSACMFFSVHVSGFLPRRDFDLPVADARMLGPSDSFSPSFSVLRASRRSRTEPTRGARLFVRVRSGAARGLLVSQESPQPPVSMAIIVGEGGVNVWDVGSDNL